MACHFVNGLGSWSFWGVGEESGLRFSHITECKVKRVRASLLNEINNYSVQAIEYRRFSSLRLLFWVGLFVGARGQLTEPFPAQFDLTSLDGTNGFIIKNGGAYANLGYSISTAGDFNGDGLSDVLIGARSATPSGRVNAGKSFVVFGSRTKISGGILDLRSLDGTNGFTINGEAQGDNSGTSVSSAGDVNGDGLTDIVIGAHVADPSGRSSAGKSYVIFGSRTVIRSGQFELSTLDGSNGFVLNGEEEGDLSGGSVSSAGDVNGDGLDDLLIGALKAEFTFSTNVVKSREVGKSYVVFGNRRVVSGGVIDLSSLNGTNGYIIIGEATKNWFGNSVSSAGDVNGDSIDDLVIGAVRASPSGRSEAGKSYVLFGSRSPISNGSFYLSSLNESKGFILSGESASDHSGVSVSFAGDVNGDGIDDIVLGAHMGSPSGMFEAGKSYVVFGNHTFFNLGNLDLMRLDGNNGFILNGEKSGDRIGNFVSTAGDVNGDGFDDIVIGAKMATPLNRSEAGKSYVIFGKRVFANRGSISLSSLNGMNGFILNGEEAGDNSGVSVSLAGDVNGDGIDDILIGANMALRVEGKGYVVFGRNFTKTTSPSFMDKSTNLETTVSSKLLASLSSGFARSLHSEEVKSIQTLAGMISAHDPIVPSSKLQPSSHSNSTPLIAGLAVAVAALACSLIAGVIFHFKRRPEASRIEPGTSLTSYKQVPAISTDYVAIDSVLPEMQSARAENVYDQITPKPPTGHYKSPPQGPQASTLDDYDKVSLPQLNQEMDQYQEVKAAKQHEGYDDIPKT